MSTSLNDNFPDVLKTVRTKPLFVIYPVEIEAIPSIAGAAVISYRSSVSAGSR
jgi:hypothetical protein